MKALLLLSMIFFSVHVWAAEVRVGSKAFTEGFLLGELASQTVENETKNTVIRKFGLGNTGITYEALKKGEIDVYAEYTGTISEAILKDPSIKDFSVLREKLKPLGLEVSDSLGFNNTYAIAVRREFAEKNHLQTISDLSKLNGQVKAAFSHEFTTRADGLEGLQKAYHINLSENRQAMEHSLAFQALASQQADLTDVYSTDSKIKSLDLVVLKDDRDYFPRYEAVFLARSEFTKSSPESWLALNKLKSSLSETVVQGLNSDVEDKKESFSKVISDYLKIENLNGDASSPSVAKRIWQRTKEHIFLVGITVLLSVLTGIPLGILATRNELFGQVILVLSSVVQTIPSLALLCLLIPFFGIGLLPALVALYLYSLLPILLNTYIGLRSIDPALKETASALGLSRMRTLFAIELPLASRSILGGVKTSTIIGIGTATLAALIGAGGYGAPIISGLAINDMPTILIGAIPCAVLSLIAYGVFEVLAKILVPRGLQK